jgi:anaerobic selenocysteine-containing dehydrogenase
MDLSANDALSPEQRAKQLGADRFKFQSFPGYDLITENTMRVWGKLPPGEQTSMASCHQPILYRAMVSGEPYPVRGLITHAHNPMVTQANTKLVYKALKSLDIHVVFDYWLTPTAELADYVLPVASWMERPDFMGDYGGEQALPAFVEGEYDRKTDYECYRGIAIRLGQDWPWENLEEVFDYMLEPKGLGYDPLPKYEEPPETQQSNPGLAKEYPLTLITGGRFRPMFHSEWRQIDSIRKEHPDPLVQIHPETAKSLDIDDGDWVWIESPRGRIRMKCEHFLGIDKQVVHCQHGWWYPELPGEEPWLHGVWESNVNVLTEDDPEQCNQINGGWPLRTALCKVYKCKTY